LRIGVFRALWIAALISQVGTWMQTVGAQWLVVHAAHAAILVALVQTAYTLPAVLFALVGGVLADIFNRARLLMAVQRGPLMQIRLPAGCGGRNHGHGRAPSPDDGGSAQTNSCAYSSTPSTPTILHAPTRSWRGHSCLTTCTASAAGPA
jgi:hypothetical protein